MTSKKAAFTLVEMLTVIAVIAILLGITIPMLRGARNTAKSASTQSLMRSISTGGEQFVLDNRRQPGFFSQRDMASSNNEDTEGFTNMQNLLLDLAGGITNNANVALGNSDPCSSPTAGGPSVIEVGPNATGRVKVDITAIGAPTKATSGTVARAYITTDAKVLRTICSPAWASGSPSIASRAMPTIVDGFGQPLLAWIQDDLVKGSPQFSTQTFTTPANAARFYWASNAGVLKGTSVGFDPNRTNQAQDSLIGSSQSGTIGVTINGFTPQARAATLMGILGNPSGGFQASATPPPTAPEGFPLVMPTAARGPIVLHSAGPNGVFVGKDERGGKGQASGTGAARFLPFRQNVDYFSSGQFDDIVTAFGN